MSKAEFTDCLIERLADKAGCKYGVTFDVGTIKHAGFKSLQPKIYGSLSRKGTDTIWYLRWPFVYVDLKE